MMYRDAQRHVSAVNALFLAEYWGLDVATLSDLRGKLRVVDSDFTVIKNRVFKKALQSPELSGSGCEVLLDYIQGPLGVIYVRGDLGATAKAVVDFMKDSDKFKIKAGLCDKALMEAKDFEAISKLPSREVLMAQLLSSMVGVHRNVLYVLSGVPRNVVGVINAIKDTKS